MSEEKSFFMNIYDISRAAGVSIASVSRVMNGAGNVSEKTKQKVMAAIEATNYRPNAYARALGSGSMKTIGIMCSDSTDIYLANAIYYLETALRKKGYHSILCCTGYDLKNKKASLDLLRSQQVDAVIMAGSKYVELEPRNNQYIIEAAKHFPIMLINGAIEAENVYATVCDDGYGTKEAVGKLCGSGCREFIYIYSSDSLSGRNKLAGLSAGCRECGIGSASFRVVQSGKNYRDVAETLEREYRERPFDAVITSSDTTGVGAVKFALRRGLSIPEELSIVSFNNSILAESTVPELTSIDSRLKELCDRTVRSLMKLLDPGEGESTVPKCTVLRPRIVARETTRF